MITQLTDLNEIPEDSALMLGASWCPSCRGLKPHYQEASEHNTDLPFTYIDVDDFDILELFKQFDIMQIPAVFKYEAGVPTKIESTKLGLLELL